MASCSCDSDEPSTSSAPPIITIPPGMSLESLRSVFDAEDADQNDEFIDVNHFNSLQTDLERVDYVYDCMQIYPEREAFAKDDKQADLLRKQINPLFTLRGFRGALTEINRSLATAKSRVEMSYAYALRSELFLRVGLVEECVRDVDRALAHEYPGRWKRTLVLRRKEALEMDQRPVEPYFEKPYRIPRCERSRKIKRASNRVEIVPHEEFGRKVVATNDLMFGDVISVEKAFAVTNLLVERGDGIHCCHCLMAQFDLIPCENCTEAFFCTEACKLEASEMYHKYECPIIGTQMLWMNPPIHLALKIAIIVRDKYLNLEEILANEEEDPWYRSDDYKVVHKLHVHRLNNQVLLKMSKCAAHLYHLIKTHTRLFEDFEDEFRDVAERSFKIILMRQIQNATVNDVMIMENPAVARKVEPIKFAFGIYPFYNVLNHSCNGNVEAFFHGSTMVLRAILPIKKGEECLVSYGKIHYSKSRKKLRQVSLKSKYGFMCNCEACKENWPKDLNSVTEDDKMTFAIEGSNIYALQKRLRQGCTEGRQVAKKLLVLIRAKLATLRPVGKLHAYYQQIGIKCYEMMGNSRREI